MEQRWWRCCAQGGKGCGAVVAAWLIVGVGGDTGKRRRKRRVSCSGGGEMEKKWGWRGRLGAHEALVNGRVASPSAYSRQVVGAA
jgi:hypothetical protein